MWGHKRQPKPFDGAGMALLCELIETGLGAADTTRLRQAAYRGEWIQGAVTRLATDLGVRLRGGSRGTVPSPGPDGLGPAVADVYGCPAEPQCDRDWLRTPGRRPPHCPVAGHSLRRVVDR
jgi:hypothetical protein